MVDTVKFIRRVPISAFFNQIGSAVEHPPIHFLQLIVGQPVLRRIEIRQIAQAVAERIADLAIGLAELGHDPLAHLHVGLIFDRSHPQAQQIGAPSFANLSGIKRVAK